MLVMTIKAGFGGQAFVPEHLTKVSRAAEIRSARDLSFRIRSTAASSPSRGAGGRRRADVLVAGSAIFGAPDRPARAGDPRRCCALKEAIRAIPPLGRLGPSDYR
jgi:ribulose-phosphate 3-epimerase